MTTMSILLYVFINQKTRGGEEHTETCAVVAIQQFGRIYY